MSSFLQSKLELRQVAKRPKKPSSPRSLTEINKKLAATRAARLKLAEENCVKMTGKTRL